jgi:hypothetical protein
MNLDSAGADVSDRVRLARVALKAAVASADVVRGDAGVGVPRVTRDAVGLLVGVTAIAQADGRYEVDLRLVARLVPLAALGAQVRERVTAAARRGGLDDQLGNVNVEFVDLQTADDTVADAAPIEQEPMPLGTTKPGEVLAGDASATLTPDAPSTQSMPSVDQPPPKGSP